MANDGSEEGIESSITQILTESRAISDGTTTQKRFCFYDAQEVQLQQFEVSATQSVIPSEKEKQNLHRFNFYDPSLLADENIPNKNETNPTINELPKHNQLTKKQGVLPPEEQEQPKIENKLDSKTNLSPPATNSGSNLIEENQPVSMQGGNDGDNNKTSSNINSNAEDILRSLQETEVQRNEILKTAATSDEIIVSTSDDGSSSDMNASNRTNNPYEDSIRAALTLLRKHKSPPQSPSVVNTLEKCETQLSTYTNSVNKELVSQPYNNNNSNSNSNSNSNKDETDMFNVDPTYDSERDRTPKEQDRLMQYRSYDEDENLSNDYTANNRNIDGNNLLDTNPGSAVDDAVLEAKLKSKQRQERMAKYASRLQEFKSNLAPEQQLDLDPSSSFQSCNQDLQTESSPRIEHGSNSDHKHNSTAPLNHIQHTIKPSSTDTDSAMGLVSELSQLSHQQRQPQQPPIPLQDGFASSNQQIIIEEQVQKGIEKVLVAILEAGKNQTISNDSLCKSSRMHDNSSYSGENANDNFLQVLDEVLNPSRTGSTSLDSFSRCVDGGERWNERTSKNNSNNQNEVRPSLSVMSQESVNSRSRKSSVVDELLAEDDYEEIKTTSVIKQPLKALDASLATLPGTIDPPPISCISNVATARYWVDEERKIPEPEPTIACLSSSNKYKNDSIINNLDHDRNNNGADASLDESFDDTKNSEDEETTSELLSSDSVDDDDEDTDDELKADSEFDEDESYEDEKDNDDDHHGRVLGPLSRGNTSGVVLDIESDLPTLGQKNTEKGYFSSVVNYMTSALSKDEQKLLDNDKNVEIIANYDKEAFELMRTLCAHLLPFGVDQKSNWRETIPAWDDGNPNEAGYRIIRLSKSQLRRVECAFDSMITSLKNNSHSSLNGTEGQLDANFIRELEEAERLLDDEEHRNVLENDKVDFINDATRPRTPVKMTMTGEKRTCDTSHPEFPGIKSAGKGEMGDLEFFQLPIIFKSHVTGFEPTKNMVLEPGNVIAGQYLVESEIGSAAFSTAYRCIDLSSEDNDGHEEVCLKVIKNTKDFFDQSLDEIKILELLRQTGKCDENYVLTVKTFFYYREHLIIVTELLRQNLFEFGKFILDNNDEPYFTLPRLASITRQCLIALRFVHKMGLVHSDVKPENILLGSYSRAQIKLIDFGSSCYLTDRQSSYIQSR